MNAAVTCVVVLVATANKPLAKSHLGPPLQLSIVLLGSAVDDNFISAYLLPSRQPSHGVLAANFSDAVGEKHAYQKNATGFCETAPVSDRSRVYTHATSASVASLVVTATRHVDIARQRSRKGNGNHVSRRLLKRRQNTLWLLTLRWPCMAGTEMQLLRLSLSV